MNIYQVPKLTPRLSVQPKFGWNKDTLANYEIRLTPEDVKNTSGMEDLAERTVDKLMGSPETTPRFVLFSNPREILKVPQAVRRFKWDWAPILFNVLTKRYPQQFNPENLNPIFWVDQRLESSRTSVPLHFEDQIKQPAERVKWMLLSYGPDEQVTPESGKAVIADPLQLCLDNGLDFDKTFDINPKEKFLNIKLRKDIGEGAREYHHRRTQLMQLLASRYSVKLNHMDTRNEMPLLVINNLVPQGVAHGGTQVTPIHPPLAKRVLGRLVCLLPVGVNLHQIEDEKNIARQSFSRRQFLMDA